MLDVVKNQVVDQRNSPRRPIHCKVKVIAPKGQMICGESFDLSPDGIGVILDCHLAIGATCTVMFAPFTHGSVKSVTAAASVVYCMLNTAGFRTGFKFLNVQASTAAVIASIIG